MSASGEAAEEAARRLATLAADSSRSAPRDGWFRRTEMSEVDILSRPAGSDPRSRSTAQPRAPDPLAELTDREREILPQVANGLSNVEIAGTPVVSAPTVRTHVSNLLGRRVRAVVLAYETRHRPTRTLNQSHRQLITLLDGIQLANRPDWTLRSFDTPPARECPARRRFDVESVNPAPTTVIGTDGKFGDRRSFPRHVRRCHRHRLRVEHQGRHNVYPSGNKRENRWYRRKFSIRVDIDTAADLTSMSVDLTGITSMTPLGGDHP